MLINVQKGVAMFRIAIIFISIGGTHPATSGTLPPNKAARYKAIRNALAGLTPERRDS
jgi:hypothetical protein